MTDNNTELQLAHPLKSSPDLFIKDPGWWAEPKYNGDRLTIEFTPVGLLAINRKGNQAQCPWFLKDIQWPEMLTGTRLDGECLPDKFIVFDILVFKGKNYRTAPYRDRRQLLETIFSRIFLRNIELAKVARTEDQKETLIHYTRESHGEGVVFKDTASLSKPGRSWHWVKYKFYSTCEAVITEVGVTEKDGSYHPEAVKLQMLLDGEPIDVGGCKIPSRYQTEQQIVAGDVVEVRYLYVSKDRRLVEPVFLRKRTDKSPDECTWDQVEQ